MDAFSQVQPAERVGGAVQTSSDVSHEWGFLILLLLFFLALNLITASRSPMVWMDEVFFTDPAHNLAAGYGFTSSVWPFQPGHRFFAGNVPFYPYILHFWIELFGFSPTAVRSLNFVLISCVVLLVSSALRRSGLIQSGRARLAVGVLIMCGYEVSFSYRTGRYDCLGMLLFSLEFWLFTCSWPRTIRSTASGLIAVLIPLTGLQLLPFTGLWFIALLPFAPRRVLSFFIPIFVGIGVGGGFLYVLLSANSVWHNFTHMLWIVSGKDEIVPTAGEVVIGFARDHPSSIILFTLLVLQAVALQIRGQFRWRTPIVFGLLFGFMAPVVLKVFYTFPKYYGWMMFVPLVIVLFAGRRQAASGAADRTLKVITTVALVILVLIGLPLRITLTILEWPQRDYAPVVAFVSDQVVSADVVFADFGAYYPAKRLAKELYVPSSLNWMDSGDKNALTLLLINPESFRSVQKAIGGDWTLVATAPTTAAPPRLFSLRSSTDTTSYRISAYRRRK